MISERRKWFDQILCPLDFAEDSDAGLRYAISLARNYEAKLYVCHCMPAAEFAEPANQRKALADLYGAVGRQILPGHWEDLDWEPVILKGDTTTEIPRHCAGHLIDLVVIRSRKRTGLAALGSTAESLVRTSPCSVLIAGRRAPEFAGFTPSEINPRKILVAYDFTPEAEDALSLGLSFAQEFQAELDLMYVLRYATIKGMGPIDPNEPDLDVMASRLKKAIPRGAGDWCRVNPVFAEGDPATEILRYADSQTVDLICMGAIADESLLYKVLGSTANRVVRRAACPVLVARPSHELRLLGRIEALAPGLAAPVHMNGACANSNRNTTRAVAARPH